MILGTQWYILFNVIAGASALPTDLKEAAGIFHVRSLAVVARRHPARHLSLLRHRRADRLGRLVERQRSSPRWSAGATPSSRPPAWAPTSPTPPPPATIPRVALGIAVMSVFVIAAQPHALAAALRLRRAPLAPGLSRSEPS